MSNTTQKRSDDFLRIADQFKLGDLTTETFHPITNELSSVARKDVAAALKLLFDVDRDVLRTCREVVDSGRLNAIADTVHHAVSQGGRVFFTGCGATGRLSILLDSVWRDYWQKQAQSRHPNRLPANDLEARTISVMAGGDFALIKSVEGFEDYTSFGRKQIRDLGVTAGDIVFAITEGGETSFVIGTAWEGLDVGAKVYFVYNNPDDILCQHVDRSREIIQENRIEKLNLTTGPMAVSGSTRMQATTIQLAVLATVLEMVVRRLSGRTPSAVTEVPRQFLTGLEALLTTLSSGPILERLAALVEAESSTYRAGGRAHYHANQLAIDVLTDTTERSPTFCTPPFRKRGDRTSSESMVFLFVPGRKTPEAWQWLLKRPPRCLDWNRADVETLVPTDKLERTVDILGKITNAELMRFAIGEDGLQDRPVAPGDFTLRIHAHPKERATETIPAHSTDWHLTFTPDTREFNAENSNTVWIPVPETGFLLDGLTRVAVKMVLNAMSTCVMVRLGRVMGNTMIYVVPSNLKLIDRATRYIVRLSNLSYVEANQTLFDAVDYVEPRMLAGQAYPPVVGLAVLHATRGLSFDAAEAALKAGFP